MNSTLIDRGVLIVAIHRSTRRWRGDVERKGRWHIQVLCGPRAPISGRRRRNKEGQIAHSNIGQFHPWRCRLEVSLSYSEVLNQFKRANTTDLGEMAEPTSSLSSNVKHPKAVICRIHSGSLPLSDGSCEGNSIRHETVCSVFSSASGTQFPCTPDRPQVRSTTQLPEFLRLKSASGVWSANSDFPEIGVEGGGTSLWQQPLAGSAALLLSTTDNNMSVLELESKRKVNTRSLNPSWYVHNEVIRGGLPSCGRQRLPATVRSRTQNDSADWYDNESECGRAILDYCGSTGISRAEIFYTTKLKMNNGYEKTLAAIQRSLDRCGLGYIDLYLIHGPLGGPQARLESWRAICDAQKEGKLKSVGVSCFGVRHLKELEDSNLPLPAINQGFIPLPKSSTKGRIAANTRLFDFELSTEEVSQLDGLDERNIAYVWSIYHSVKPTYHMITFGTLNLKHGMNLGLSLIPCPINFVEADRTNVCQHPLFSVCLSLSVMSFIP
ncbi:Aldo-keto reductase [Salix suchowensis]|nr:Aldo-keto reductase [Salix suchowensis]